MPADRRRQLSELERFKLRQALWQDCVEASATAPRCAQCRALITSSVRDGNVLERFCGNGHHWLEITDPLDEAFVRKLAKLRAGFREQTGTGYY